MGYGNGLSDEIQFKERLDKRVEKGKGGRKCGKDEEKLKRELSCLGSTVEKG